MGEPGIMITPGAWPPHALRATIIAPLTAPLLYWAGSFAFALADPVRRSYADQNMFGALAVVGAGGAPVAYAATLLIALPALWLLSKIGPLTPGRTMLTGLVTGVAVGIPLARMLRGDLFSVPMPLWAAGALGAASAAVWWRCARR